MLRLENLAPGSRLAERARRARYAALETKCAELGIVHLLLGHHAADQAETVAMRMLRGSGAGGLAGMAALTETPWVRLLRPLLAVPPGRLRATLRGAGLDWIEDPSNRDPTSLRARLRALRRDPDGAGPVTAAALRAAIARGQARARDEGATAGWLGRHARLDPRGFAVLDALPPCAAPLAALLRAVAGAPLAPRSRAVKAWLAAPRAATLHGVIIRPAGRLAAGGWLLCREPAAMAAGVAARTGAIWDGRFRLLPGEAGRQTGALLGAASARTALPRLLDRTRPGLYPELAERADMLVAARAGGGRRVPAGNRLRRAASAGVENECLQPMLCKEADAVLPRRSDRIGTAGQALRYWTAAGPGTSRALRAGE